MFPMVEGSRFERAAKTERQMAKDDMTEPAPATHENTAEQIAVMMSTIMERLTVAKSLELATLYFPEKPINQVTIADIVAKVIEKVVCSPSPENS
jgi:hypothetical protein